MAIDLIPYDEFSYFADNASEHGIPYEVPPVVRREMVQLSDGRQLSALVWGTTEPEVIFIHGGAQNAHTWDTVMLSLGRPGIAIDLPGHGHSGPPAGATTDVRRNAADVMETIDELAPLAPMLVGMSLGGLTSFALIDAHPDHFDTVLIVDITPSVKRENAEHIAAFVNGPTSFDSFDELLERTMEFNPTRSESSLRRGILHNAEQRSDGSWVWRHAKHRVFDNPDAAAEEPAEETRDYHKLWSGAEEHRGRLVLARGLRSNSVVTDDQVDELRQRRPDVIIENFAEAGHSIQGDMPVELAGLIATELDRVVELELP